MKQKNLFKIVFTLILAFAFGSLTNAQSAGDIAFIGFNADGDRDFTIVVLADIAANSTIYFTDDSTTGTGSPSTLNGSEGTITWSTGAQIISAGTVVNFTDVDSGSNDNFGASIGSITRSGSFTLTTSSRDNILAYTGTLGTPSTYIAGIQIGTISGGNYAIGPFDGDGITLTNTGLVIGTSLILANNSATPDGMIYNSSRTDKSSYSSYYAEIENNSNWTNVVNGDGESLLPFSQEAFTINTRTWTGSTSSDWTLPGNWDSGVPNEDSNVIIPNVTTGPVVSTSVNTGNITINEGGQLTISGAINNKGLTTINSGGTLVSSGTISGNVTYKRTLANGSQWYLMSSPVIGETYDDYWVTANSIASGSTTATNRGVSTYDNTVNNATTGHWRYLQSGGSGTFNVGQGYGIITSSSGTISFTGSGVYTSSQTFGIMPETSNFNLIGNPFTAFLNLGEFFGDNGSGVISGATTWFWNGASYDAKMSGTDASFEIAPGQAFFVEAASSSNVTFDINDVSHQGTDTFQKSENSRTEITLHIDESKNTRYAKIFYFDSTTKGYDIGFDGKLFEGVSHNLAIYTDLLESDGKKYQVQSLPNSDYENMIIPIGLIAKSGKQITFTSETLNLPTGLKVYLEDRLTNTFTRLDEANSKYTISLKESNNGTGRFYLHTTQSVLTIDDSKLLNSVAIFKVNETTLRIKGLPQGKTTITLFNTLGKQVLSSSFSSNTTNEITLPKLSSGVYFAKLQTERGKLTKKIILE